VGGCLCGWCRQPSRLHACNVLSLQVYGPPSSAPHVTHMVSSPRNLRHDQTYKGEGVLQRQ